MVVYSPLGIPSVEPTDTPVTFPAKDADAANVIDGLIVGVVTVSTEAPPATPPPSRDGLLWVQVS